MRGTPVLRYLFTKYSRAEGSRIWHATSFAQHTAGCSFSTSSVCCKPKPVADFLPNRSIVPKFVNNRNPRNLEKLRIAEKPAGYQLERESRQFWNKVTLTISSKHISAAAVHYLGQKPITASTTEWCIKKYLYSTNDASAAKLVGEVFARRCLQAGITELACFFPEEQRQKEKVNLFLSAVEEGGVTLSEPSQVVPDWNIHHYEIPETPWEVHEDVDDRFSVACKLPNRVVRDEKNPKGRDKLKQLKEKYAEVGYLPPDIHGKDKIF